MLIDPKLRPQDPILSIIAGSSLQPTRLEAGIYQIGHFSFDLMISRLGGNLTDSDEWDPWADDLPFEVPCSGVCDSVPQFMRKFGDVLRNDTASYCISFTRIAKSEQPLSGGWRWHKWGEYVGEGEPTTEYLYHEPKFEEVFVFHIFRKRP